MQYWSIMNGVKWIDYVNVERSVGITKFPFARVMKYAVTGLLAYSVILLVCISLLGFVMIILAICMLVAMGVMLLNGSASNFGIGITLLLMMNSLVVFCAGILALYISQIHKEVKHRPRYIVRDTNIIK